MTAHVHAENMMLYAQDAAETPYPWTRWECRPLRCNNWFHFSESPTWRCDHEYRRKPRTHKVNGFEVPEPMREAPANQSDYWLPAPHRDQWAIKDIWADYTDDLRNLERGLVHATKEAAVANAKAMLGIAP